MGADPIPTNKRPRHPKTRLDEIPQIKAPMLAIMEHIPIKYLGSITSARRPAKGWIIAYG